MERKVPNSGLFRGTADPLTTHAEGPTVSN